MDRFALLAMSLLLVLALIGCHTTNSEDSAIFLRLENKSDIDFSSAILIFPKAKATFGTIAAGKASNYYKFNSAYRYGYIKVETRDTTYKHQPNDYVGEEPLKGGYYTYELNFVRNSLNLEFKED